MIHPFKLGNNKPLIDGRNLLLGKVQTPVPNLPLQYWNTFVWGLPPETIDLYYQRQTPSCGAHATALLKYILDSKDTSASHKPYSARFNWNRIRARDGLSASEGSWLKDILAVLKNSGACDIDLLPNDTTLDDFQYVWANITPEMLENATPKQIGSYTVDTSPTFNQIKQAIFQNGAVILLTDVSERWWTNSSGNTSWTESDILPLYNHLNSQTVSRHYFVAHSYDEKYIYGLNSFSSKWGKGGHLYFGEDYLPHVLQMATAQDIPDALVKNLITQASLLQKLVALYQQLVALKVKKYV